MLLFLCYGNFLLLCFVINCNGGCIKKTKQYTCTHLYRGTGTDNININININKTPENTNTTKTKITTLNKIISNNKHWVLSTQLSITHTLAFVCRNLHIHLCLNYLVVVVVVVIVVLLLFFLV